MIPGEVERLLKEYRQNQELVRKIGGHFYQIIYPVQLRHHEKMGISTREVGGSKVRFSLGRRNVMNTTTVCHLFIYSHSFVVLINSLHCTFITRSLVTALTFHNLFLLFVAFRVAAQIMATLEDRDLE